jgi:ribonucleoside-diphosphate reductase beta chain
MAIDRVAIAQLAELKQLGDIPIDDVLEIMDQEAPDYRALFYRWEGQQWEAGAIDFSEDRRQWVEDFTPELRERILWGLSSFYDGDEQATDMLVPFVDAMPSEEQQVFLTTQLADAGRHVVFFDRFFSDVSEQRDDTTGKTLLHEILAEAADKIRREPGNPVTLTEGVVLYHIFMEGALAITGQRFLVNFVRERGLLPGFAQGLTAVARDEARHVLFGVRFLKEIVTEDAGNANVIRDTLTRAVSVGKTVLEPLPFDAQELTAFAMNSLTKRRKVIGVDLAI